MLSEEEAKSTENVPEEEPKKKRGRPKGSTTKKTKSAKTGLTASEAAALVDAEEKATTARIAAAKAQAEEAVKKEYEAAAAEAVVTEVANVFTNKRGAEVIFRRELGEPEFFLDKNARGPPRPILSQDEEEAISLKVETPTDQTPKYDPKYILSPEFEGVSNYERGIGDFREELEQKLEKIEADPNSSEEEIIRAEEDLKTLDYLYENFHLGMNVFRTAKGGRKK